MISRLLPPHKLDHAPRGTLCRVDKGESFDIYRQLAENEEDPHWDFIDNFTESSYELYNQINR